MDLGLREDFMNFTLKAREVKAKINKWDYMKLKSIFVQQSKLSTTKTQKTTSRIGEDICKQQL